MKLGVIGTGKMGSALLRGILDTSTLQQKDIAVYNHSEPNIKLLVADYPDITVCRSAIEVAEQCDVVMLSIKPYGILKMLGEVTNAGKGHSPLFISVAAGITINQMEQASKPGTRIIRTAPNTPALIGQGATAYTLGSEATPQDNEILVKLLSPAGMLEAVPETQLDAIAAIAGSSPAYMFVILDALCEAGVALGLPRNRARHFAVQAMLGSAMLAKQTDRHLMELRDDVTSPGGSTIAALNVMDRTGLRHSLIEGAKAAERRTKEMSGN